MPLNYNVFSQSDPVPVFDPAADDLRRQQAQAGQLKLREYQEQRQRENALRPLVAEYAGGNRARLADIMAIDPERGMAFQGAEQAQAEAARKQEQAAQTDRRARAMDLARVFDGTKTWEDYAARRNIASRLGYTPDELDDLPDSPDQFDPAYFAQLSNVVNNTSIKDGRSVTQERGTINYGTDEDIRQEADKQGYLDARERFTQGAQDRRSVASNNVTMRGQNMTDARARETQVAPGMMTPKEARRQADKWRQDFDTTPEVKAYRAAVPVLVSAARAAPTAAGDLDLIYAMGKIMDPNSVVREGEMKLAGGAGSWADRLQGFVGKGSGAGPGLPAGMRKRLVDALANRVAALGGSYNQTASTYEGYAKGSGIDPKYLVGEHPGQQIRNAGLTSGSKKTSPAGGAVKIANDADYANLKSGALFIAPDGSRRRKP